MQVLFRLDASRQIGIGHLARCLTLANVLASSGGECVFALSPSSREVQIRIASAGHAVVISAVELLPDQITKGWEASKASAAQQNEDAHSLRVLMGSTLPDLVVVDHYRLDANWEAEWPEARVCVIDDLADRTHACEVLLDQTSGRILADYRDQIGSDTNLLLGSQFALLRPEFGALRNAALDRRAAQQDARSIFVNFGGGDFGGLTLAVLQELARVDFNGPVAISLGGMAKDCEPIGALSAQHKNWDLRIDDTEVAGAMANADIAIGGCGATSWERCALGLPSIVMQQAENQAVVAKALISSGASIKAGDAAEAVAHALALKDDVDLWHDMAACSAALCDGLGAMRVARRLVGYEHDTKLRIRPANSEDRINLWAWRNDPFVRAASPSPAPIPLRGHSEWFANALSRDDRAIFIGEQDGENIGMVRFDVEGTFATISIALAPVSRGKGLGPELLAQAIEAFSAPDGVETLEAMVAPENAASQRLFASAGFHHAASVTPFDCFVRKV